MREVSPPAHSRGRGRFEGSPGCRVSLGGDCKLHAAVAAGGFGGVEMCAEGGVESEGLGSGGIGVGGRAEREVGGGVGYIGWGVEKKMGLAEEEVVEGTDGEDYAGAEG